MARPYRQKHHNHHPFSWQLYTKKTAPASTLVASRPGLIKELWGSMKILFYEHFGHLVALATDNDAGSRVFYAYALEVEVFYGSVFVGYAHAFNTGG